MSGAPQQHRSVGGRTSPGEGAIRFGTSGWRGVLGEEVTYPRLRVLIRSVADWIHEQGSGDRVLIGWDGRFASESMAQTTALLLVDAGLRPLLATHRTPTPAVTHALARRRCAAGLVLTASHNAPSYHGLKVFGADGGSIVDEQARRIEVLAAARMDDTAVPLATKLGRRIDLTAAYRDAVASQLDAQAVRDSGLTVVYDAMHGAAGGVLDSVLLRSGARVEGIRLDADPRFGGGAPDPCPENLQQLVARMRAIEGLSVGLATDGDGDRVGVVDGTGRILSETQVLAVLVDHLARAGRIRRGVATTVGTGSLVEKVARRHDLRVERLPVGFKHLSEAIRAGRVDVAGEESGGFALASMGRDKDGILAGCLLANLVATSGEPLEDHLDRLEAEFGASACGRTALASDQALELGYRRLVSQPPERIGRARVVDVEDRCGLRLGLSDGGFLILRRSGTEPVFRVYAEASDPTALAERLRLGTRLLERTARPVRRD